MIPIRRTGVASTLSWALAAAIWAAPAPIVVHADFEAPGGPESIREVHMLVDGVDVTARSQVGALRVAYTPTGKLSAGPHACRVVVVDVLGRTFTQEWTFSAVDGAPLVAFYSDALRVELDALPRRTLLDHVRVSGVTQPGAEVTLRRDQQPDLRATADLAGRFTVPVDLALGENRLAASASRADTLQEGVESELRVERVTAAAEVPPEVASPPPLDRPHVVDVPAAGAVDPAQLHPLPIVEKPPEALPPPRAHDDIAAGHVQVPALEVQPVVEPPPDEAEVVITKPSDGDAVRASHVTVLGRAPAGWSVSILVDENPAGSDVANPAGHFTVPRVELSAGDHVLVAEASGDGRTLRSAPVAVRVGGGAGLLAAEALTLTSPARSSVLARDGALRVEGVAWGGAEIEAEVDGAVVTREIAGPDGRFAMNVPLDDGSHLLAVEAHGMESDRSARSGSVLVTARGGGRARRVPPSELYPVLPHRGEVPQRLLPRGASPR